MSFLKGNEVVTSMALLPPARVDNIDRDIFTLLQGKRFGKRGKIFDLSGNSHLSILPRIENLNQARPKIRGMKDTAAPSNSPASNTRQSSFTTQANQEP